MTPTTNTNPIAVEGNVWEIDFNAKFFKLSGRDHKPFLKVYWKPQHETDTSIRKIKPGYYVAPVVDMEADTGGMREAWLVGLPYKERPADYPKIPKTGKGNGGGQPRNERLIAAESLLKSYVDPWRMTNTPDQVTFKNARDEIKTAVEEDLPWLMKQGGV
jgi:hypothetical protein